MSYNLDARQTFHTSTAVGPRLRVKLTGSLIVDLAGAGDEGVGFADAGNQSVVDALGNTSYTDIAVVMGSAEGTFEAVANGAIALNSEYYGAAAGKISATPVGRPLGRVLEAAAADGDIVRVTLYAVPKQTLAKNIIAASVSEYLYVADGPMKLAKAQLLPEVVGSDGGAVTAAFRKIIAGSGALASDAAGANVKELLAGTTVDLKSAAGTPVVPALSATPANLLFATGDILAVKYAGTMTAVVALAQFEFVRQ